MESPAATSSTEIMKDDTDHTSGAIAAAATAAAAATLTATSTTASLLSEQDQVVYGTLNKELADVLAEQITIAIRNGVDSLPLLDDDCYRKSSNTSSNTSSRTAKQQEKKQDDHQAETNDNDAKTKKTTSDTDTGTPKQNLCQTLKYKFIRNVDVLESYCAHHLFTLKKHLPARRKRIVSTITSNGLEVLPLSSSSSEQEQQKSNEQEEEEEEEDDHSPTTTTTIIRSKNELPSSKEVSNLMNEVSALQKQLELIRKERNELLVLQESTTRAEVYVNEITNTSATSATDTNNVVSKVVTDGNTIGRLADEAKHMIQKLDTTTTTTKKRGKEGDDNDDEDGEDEDHFDFEQQDHNNGSNKRLKPLSMKETYEQDKKQLGLSLNNDANTNDGLNTIKDMLLLSKEESK
jgi:hypothetical protein